MPELSYETLSFKAVTTSDTTTQQGSSYIPFADRYAVVPDHSRAELAERGKSKHVEPDGKRHCT